MLNLLFKLNYFLIGAICCQVKFVFFNTNLGIIEIESVGRKQQVFAFR